MCTARDIQVRNVYSIRPNTVLINQMRELYGESLCLCDPVVPERCPPNKSSGYYQRSRFCCGASTSSTASLIFYESTPFPYSSPSSLSLPRTGPSVDHQSPSACSRPSTCIPPYPAKPALDNSRIENLALTYFSKDSSGPSADP